MNVTIIWIMINSFLYIGMGIFTFIAPQKVATTVGYILSRPGAIAELKACYGGLMFALGALMLYLLYKQDVKTCLGFLVIIYLGFGIGRLIGIIGDRAFDSTTLIYSAVEISSIIISYWLYRTQ